VALPANNAFFFPPSARVCSPERRLHNARTHAKRRRRHRRRSVQRARQSRKKTRHSGLGFALSSEGRGTFPVVLVFSSDDRLNGETPQHPSPPASKLCFLPSRSLIELDYFSALLPSSSSSSRPSLSVESLRAEGAEQKVLSIHPGQNKSTLGSTRFTRARSAPAGPIHDR